MFCGCLTTVMEAFSGTQVRGFELHGWFTGAKAGGMFLKPKTISSLD